jgi:hypothetical protein
MRLKRSLQPRGGRKGVKEDTQQPVAMAATRYRVFPMSHNEVRNRSTPEVLRMHQSADLSEYLAEHDAQMIVSLYSTLRMHTLTFQTVYPRFLYLYTRTPS